MQKMYTDLFQPIKIGQLEIKNRFVMAPMAIVGMVNTNGTISNRGIDYYIERARGEVGLIITTWFRVDKSIEPFIDSLPLVSPSLITPLAELTEAVHSLGTKIFVQLTAGHGRVARSRLLTGKPVSSSPNPYFWNSKVTCRELGTDEVERLVKSFGDSALMLKEAGADGIEIHGHEGYLFDQFTSSIWNRRNDKYGGNLLDRLRFPIETLEEIKKQAGNEFPVQYRFGLKHYIKGLNEGALPGERFDEAGRDIQEGLQMAEILEKNGYDSLHVDAGCYDSWYWAHPPTYQRYGCMIDMASKTKEVVRIPVVGVGKLDLPEVAEKVIQEGQADLVAIGRGLLADPYFVKKIKEGCPEQIRPCIYCQDGCSARIHAARPLSCSVNPASGRENKYALKMTNSPKEVMIVGGGLAGLEAARVSAFRGHKVFLYEKTHRLGGHYNEATIPSFKTSRLLDWYKRQMTDLSIAINYEVLVDEEFVQKKNPDILIIATGSKPIMIDVPGLNQEKIVTAIDLLSGTKNSGMKVIVLGGGLVGCETALWLAQMGKEVVVVEKLEEILMGNENLPHAKKMMLIDLFNCYDIKMYTETSLLEVTEEGVILLNKSFERITLPADTVVLAVGFRPDRDLYNLLRNKIANVFLVGDCRKAMNIMNSIWDAYEVARFI